MDKAIQAAASIVREFLYEAEEIAHLRLRERTSALDDWANRITNAAIEAAAPIIRAEVEREIVEWLREVPWPYRNDQLISAIERGDHRKQPKPKPAIMDVETARDRTWP